MQTKVNLDTTGKPRETHTTNQLREEAERPLVSPRVSTGEGDAGLVSTARTCPRLRGASGDPALHSSYRSRGSPSRLSACPISLNGSPVLSGKMPGHSLGSLAPA